MSVQIQGVTESLNKLLTPVSNNKARQKCPEIFNLFVIVERVHLK
jgi:hypothetical protein